jgi:glutathione S-transferase
MLPPLQDADQRSRVQQFIHAAEGTLLLHALAITYLRWFSPPGTDISQTEAGMSINVHKDLDWLERELEGSKSGWLLGEYEHPTAADVMCHFSVQFIFARGLGVKEEDKGKWKRVRAWLEKCEGCEGYRRAVSKTGYTLFPKTM